jgi:hypothetical protein
MEVVFEMDDCWRRERKEEVTMPCKSGGGGGSIYHVQQQEGREDGSTHSLSSCSIYLESSSMSTSPAPETQSPWVS